MLGVAAFILACQSSATGGGKLGTAEVNSAGVFVDGKPFKILAGEIHYFRVVPEYWRDRLQRLQSCGLNTVSTYCPWNAHEPRPGEFNFEGQFDLGAYLKLCQEMGIKVMLRPGPYICSEWDFGGLPAWLITDPNVVIRSSNKAYLDCVRAYYKKIFDVAKPYFCNNGGPIIAIQIENGYASWGNEIAYLEILRDMVLDTGFKGIIYTADGDSDVRINALKPKGVWRTLMCGFDLEKGIDIMRASQPETPQMITEWWVGQGLRLGQPRKIRNIQEMSEELDAVLAGGSHIACYMFHGGTSYGFMSGALRFPPKKVFTPFQSSYDVDAMVAEEGDITPKYLKFREVFLKYNPDAKKFPVPANPQKAAYGKINFTQVASMRANLDNLAAKTVRSPNLLTMEDLGQWYGFINYKTRMQPQTFPLPVEIFGVRDRAWVSLDGEDKAVFSQTNKTEPLVLDIPKDGAELDILVENMGRVNFSLTMLDNRKGITGNVVLNNQQFQKDWLIQSLPLDDLSKLAWKPVEAGAKIKYPAFFKGVFNVGEKFDTFLSFPNAKRGYVWLNGFLLGRYDNAGPMLTTYVAAPFLKQGQNVVEILELENLEEFSIESVSARRIIERGDFPGRRTPKNKPNGAPKK